MTCLTAGQFISDPDDCQKYYVCNYGGVSLTPQPNTCPEGQYFDSSRNVCDLASRVACTADPPDAQVPSTSTEAVPTTVETRSLGKARFSIKSD